MDITVEDGFFKLFRPIIIGFSFQVVGVPEKTLMVRHLSPDTSERRLSRVFSKYGELEKCRVIRDVISGYSKKYAFIEYKHEDDARKAIQECHNLLIDNYRVTVDYECERILSGWKPRRFGGGFGGKKESGQLRFGGIDRPFRRPIPLNSKPLGNTSSGARDSNSSSRGMKRDINMTRDKPRHNSSSVTRNRSNTDRTESHSKRHRR